MEMDILRCVMQDEGSCTVTPTSLSAEASEIQSIHCSIYLVSAHVGCSGQEWKLGFGTPELFWPVCGYT